MAKVIKHCLVIGAVLLLQDIIIKRCGFLSGFNHQPKNILRNLAQRVLEKTSVRGLCWVFLGGFFDFKLRLELHKPNILNENEI